MGPKFEHNFVLFLTFLFLPWVLPIDVKTVELVVSQELNSFIDELIHAEDVGGQLFEGSGAERPATNGEEDLEMTM